MTRERQTINALANWLNDQILDTHDGPLPEDDCERSAVRARRKALWEVHNELSRLDVESYLCPNNCSNLSSDIERQSEKFSLQVADSRDSR